MADWRELVKSIRKEQTRYYTESSEAVKRQFGDKVFYCVVCGKNQVHPEYGEDTCSDCLGKV